MPEVSASVTDSSFDDTARLFSTGGTIVGSITVCVGVVLLVVNLNALQIMEQTEGVVVRYRENRELIARHPERSRLHAPYVLYSVDGKDYVTGCRVYAEGQTRAHPGDKLLVRYPQDEPAAGRVMLFWDFWFATILTLCAGFVFILGSRLLTVKPKYPSFESAESSG